MNDTSDIALKYQRLAQEYAKLKAQNQVLKKAVLDVKDDAAKLQISVQEKEQIIRRSQQEIDSTNFRSQQMVKRIELLQLELEQKDKKGKVVVDKNHSNVSSVLDEDLRQKIYENELLHKQVHEYDTEKRQMEQRFKDELSAAKLNAKASSEELEKMRETHLHQSEQLKSNNLLLETELQSLKSESLDTTTEMNKQLRELEGTNEKLELQVAHFKSMVGEVVVFNDREIGDYNQLKLMPHNKRYEARAQDLFKNAVSLIGDFCKSLNDFHLYNMQRGNLYPVDSTLQKLPVTSVNLTEFSTEATIILDSLASAFNDAFHISATSQHEGILRLGDFAGCFEQYIAVFSKFLPYQLSYLEKESELSVCVPALQVKNAEFVSSFKKFFPALSKLSTYMKFIIGENIGSESEDRVEKVKFSCQKVVSSLNELHLLFKDLSKAFNSKIALEQQLPTTTKAPELQSANEFLLGSFLSLSSTVAKISGFLQTDIDFISEAVALNKNAIMSKICLSKKTGEFMEKVNISSPPQSVPYQEAIDRKRDIQSENREELLQQLQEATKKLQTLEREKEHWLLETQLLQMKLEKVKTVEIKQESGEVGRSRNESLSLKPIETGMLGDIESAKSVDFGSKSTEELIKEHLTARLSEAALKAQVAEGKALHFENECRMLHKHLAMLRNKKQSLHDEVDASSQRVSQLQDELSVTQRSYEEKLSLMSEHLTVMNDKIATQKDEIESLKTKTGTPKKSKPFRLHGL